MAHILLSAVITTVLLVASCGAVGAGPRGLVEKIKHFFNPFGYTLDMGNHIDKFRFTFIVIRSSFRAPDNSKSPTFPNDQNYKRKWSRGEQTRLGGKMAKMLGRSLEYSRYGTIMTMNWVESDRPVRISALKKPYAESTARAFEEGYLEHHRETFHYAPFQYAEFDKTELFENSALCPEYDRLWKMVQASQEKEFLARPENQKFLLELRQNILKQPENVNDEWYLDSLRKVYWLHDILDFEKVTRNKKPRWMTKDIQNKMNEFVLEYFKESIHGDDTMAKYLVGPLLSEILKKDRDGFTRLHAHVTDERTFAAFKSLISDGPATPTEFGEMILIDVDREKTALVINYLPISNTIMKIPVPFKNLDEFESLFAKYLLPDKTWSAACNGQPYDGDRSSASSLGHKPSPWLSSSNSGKYDSFGSYGTTKYQVPNKWSYSSLLGHEYKAPEATAESYSNGRAASTAPTANVMDFKWKDDEYIPRKEFYEVAKREPIQNRKTKGESNRFVVRPVIQPYKPWRAEVENELSYSSEEDDSVKSRGQENTGNGLSSPTSTRGFGNVGPRVSDETNPGGLGSVGSPVKFGTYDTDTSRGSSTSYDYSHSNSLISPPKAEKTSFYPSPVFESDLTKLQKEKINQGDEPKRGFVLSSDLQNQHIDFNDGHDYFKHLPKAGEFARGTVHKNEDGRRTVQESTFKIVKKPQSQENNSGCFDNDGRKINCYLEKKIDNDQYLTHSAQIYHEPLY